MGSNGAGKSTTAKILLGILSIHLSIHIHSYLYYFH
ncbi:MAG: hypothetical protein AB2421_15050 [Thermotaleaceae bacterium]